MTMSKLSTRRFVARVRKATAPMNSDQISLLLDYCYVLNARVPAPQRASALLSRLAARRVDRLLDLAVGAGIP